MEIKRKSIKRKLLAKVIFRTDYRQLSDNELNKVVELIKENKSDAFNNFTTEASSSYDLQINDSDIESKNIGLRKLQDFINYVFIKSEIGEDCYKLKISKNFVLLEIYPSYIYKGTDIYYDLYADVLNIMFDELKLFNLSRIGIRKFNNFFYEANKISEINKIFTSEMMPLYEVDKSKFKKRSMVDSYEKDLYGINIVRELNHGLLEVLEDDCLVEKEVYLIGFDYDMYSIENSVLGEMKIKPNEILKNINDEIFSIFIKGLQPEFLEFLMQDDPDLRQYSIYKGE